MRLGQIKQDSRPVAAILDNGSVRPVRDWSMLELIHRSEEACVVLSQFASDNALPPVAEAQLIIPIAPVEVWASGCTYESSAAFRDAEHGTREGFYAHVYTSERPEIFFKGTARHCVGSGEPVGIRIDSKFTAPEPELAVVLGAKGKILGFTLANDVSAWDIEKENPLYLPQSKTYTACCSLGPVLVTADEIENPYGLELTCRILRNGQTLFSGSTLTSRLNRKLESIVDFLLRSNPVPSGSVLATGTGIIVQEKDALQPGDVVEIECAQIGVLTNTVTVV